MYAGILPELLHLIRCPLDAGELEFVQPPSAAAVRSGSLRCTACAQTFPIEHGIAVLLPPGTMHVEGAFEKTQRDHDAVETNLAWEDEPASRSEMESTLTALEPLRDTTVLELGCGCGRYTHLFATARAIVAVDFSIESLRRLASRLSSDLPVILICGDITCFKVAPGAFDRVFSTLTSNLPEAEHREQLYRLAGTALAAGGRFVSSAHYFGLRERWHREQKSGHYAGSNIYRRCFGSQELRAETLRFFGDVTCRRIVVLLPFISRLGLAMSGLARVAESIPAVNWFASLLLVTASKPRLPVQRSLS